MFWAWVHGKISSDLAIVPRLRDIQELNRLALKDGPLPLTKVSMATYLRPEIRERYQLLRAGAALGRGCGPLIVSKEPWNLAHPRSVRLAIPGRDTTACKLAEMAMGSWVEEWVEMRYDEIMPAVLEGSRVDAGVIIHESRFTYQNFGLKCALDLGDWWEKETKLPLPLGLMLAHKALGAASIEQVELALRESVVLARETLSRPADDQGSKSLWKYMRENAVELEDSTIKSHVELYVNEFSEDLGTEGLAAVQAFETMTQARESMLTPSILYRDEHLLGVVKPFGMPTQRDQSGDPSLQDWVTDHLGCEAHLVHRLDRGTGGIVMFGLSKPGTKDLSQQFAERKVKKTYLAIVDGRPGEDELELSHHIAKLPGKNFVRAYDKAVRHSKPAHLQLKVLDSKGGNTLLEIFPSTGRRHQIRAQLRSIKCRILGDAKYGKKQAMNYPGMALWAHQLSFIDRFGDEIQLCAEPPQLSPWSDFEMT